MALIVVRRSVAHTENTAPSMCNDRYRLIDGRTEFAVEITNELGDIHVFGGFPSLVAVDVWTTNRREVAEAAEAYRAKLRQI